MKKSRRWFSLLSALIVALAMTILMTAVSFADGEERVCTFSDGRWDPDPLTISVGETVRIDNTDAVNGTKIGVYNHETEEMVQSPQADRLGTDRQPSSGWSACAGRRGRLR